VAEVVLFLEILGVCGCKFSAKISDFKAFISSLGRRSRTSRRRRAVQSGGNQRHNLEKTQKQQRRASTRSKGEKWSSFFPFPEAGERWILGVQPAPGLVNNPHNPPSAPVWSLETGEHCPSILFCSSHWTLSGTSQFLRLRLLLVALGFLLPQSQTNKNRHNVNDNDRPRIPPPKSFLFPGLVRPVGLGESKKNLIIQGGRGWSTARRSILVRHLLVVGLRVRIEERIFFFPSFV